MQRLRTPVEDQFHKYPVLRIPTEKRNDQLIIGLEKARAILVWLDDIKSFVERHASDSVESQGMGDFPASPEPHKKGSNQVSIAQEASRVLPEASTS